SRLRRLLRWGDDRARRRQIEERLAADDARTAGLREYLRYRWSGSPPAAFPVPDDPVRRCPFWDWDPAVLARKVERLGAAGRRAALDVMPFLLGHADERGRTPAPGALAEWGEPPPLPGALPPLPNPRAPAAATPPPSRS